MNQKDLLTHTHTKESQLTCQMLLPRSSVCARTPTPLLLLCQSYNLVLEHFRQMLLAQYVYISSHIRIHPVQACCTWELDLLKSEHTHRLDKRNQNKLFQTSLYKILVLCSIGTFSSLATSC